jgi:hypothetical protein
VTATVITAKPPEIVGRDTISRMNMQFQAAAFASLQILEASETDKVYCDWHDDFVVRKTTAQGVEYHFYQVKTKKKLNGQWSMLEVFALKKKAQGKDEKSLLQIQKSFAGKLFVHSITFEKICRTLTFITNVHCEDELVELVEELKCGDYKSSQAQFLSANFTQIFSSASSFTAQKIAETLEKFRLEPGIKHMGFDMVDFSKSAREAIYNYSEIDLTHAELMGIAQGLVELVHRKSHSEVLGSFTPEELETAVGVGIEDLLGVLSISPDAYGILRDGGDSKALKNASIIQRVMRTAGASDSAIEYLSQKKVEWDLWLRNTRHSVPDYELNIVLEMISKSQLLWSRGAYTLEETDGFVEELLKSPHFQKIPSLTKPIVLGGLLAALVRQRSQ